MAVVARNLALTPSPVYGNGVNGVFKADSTETGSRLQAGLLDVADRAGAAPGGGTGPRWAMPGISSGGGMLFPVGKLAPGDYVFLVRFNGTDATDNRRFRVGLTPLLDSGGSLYPVTANGVWRRAYPTGTGGSDVVLPFSTAAYVDYTVPLTIPADRPGVIELRNSVGSAAGAPNSLDLDTADYAVLIEHPTSGLIGAVSAIRLDTPQGVDAVPGYIDGNTPDTTEHEFTWEGTPGASATVVTSTVEPDPEPVVIPVPAAQRTADGYSLPDVPGVRWTVNGETASPGDYNMGAITEPTTVTIIPEALEGYVFDTVPVPLVLVFEPAPGPDPDPDPDPEPGDWSHLLDEDPQARAVADRLGGRVLVHAAAPGGDTELAGAHVLTVLEYVKGYTRDRGFHGYIPERALQAVIIAAAARLFVNPDQLTYYATGDYSERPATLTGWTAAELGVLRRYRRTYQ